MIAIRLWLHLMDEALYIQFSVLQLVSGHVVEDQDNGFIKFGMEHGHLKRGGWSGLGCPTFSPSLLKFELEP